MYHNLIVLLYFSLHVFIILIKSNSLVCFRPLLIFNLKLIQRSGATFVTLIYRIKMICTNIRYVIHESNKVGTSFKSIHECEIDIFTVHICCTHYSLRNVVHPQPCNFFKLIQPPLPPVNYALN